MFHHRVGKFQEKLTFPEAGECRIYVTHGFVVREMCWRMQQIPNIMGEVKYCGYAAFGREGKE